MLKIKIKYLKYLYKWYIEHSGPEFKGMKPVCFDEWYNNEYQYELEENSEEDSD